MTPGVIGSLLVVPASVYCDWVRNADLRFLYQCDSKYNRFRSLACGTDVKHPTNNKNLFEVIVMFLQRHCGIPLTSLSHPTDVTVIPQYHC